MAPRCRSRERAPVTVAFEGIHWDSYITGTGKERFSCLFRPCPAKGDYCYKDALDRHLVRKHRKKTLRRLPLRRNRRAPKSSAPADDIDRRHPTRGFVRFRVPPPSSPDATNAPAALRTKESPFKRTGYPLYVRRTSPILQDSGAASKIPGILKRGRHDGGAGPSAVQNPTSGHGSPAYHHAERRLRLKLKRSGPSAPSSQSPIAGDEDQVCDDNKSSDGSLPPSRSLSPIEITRYSPHELKVSGMKNIFQSIFLPDDHDERSPYDMFYRDCEPPKSGKSSRGNTENNPIRIGVSPNKSLASGIPGEGTLNVQWEGGGKSTFYLPLQKNKVNKLKLGEDVDDDAVSELEGHPPGKAKHGEDADFNLKTTSLSVPSVSQLLTDLHVDVEGNTESEIPPADGQAQFSPSEIPLLSQLPSLSQISLPALEELAKVPDTSDITSLRLVDYVSDSAPESPEI